MDRPRTLLLTGAAGAGRTTVAAATAAAAAREGRAVLLLTADPAVTDGLLPPAAGHAGGPAGGVSPVTGLPLPYPVDGVDGLYAAVADTTASFRAEALNLQGRVGGLLALLGAAPLDPEELTELPGSDALALLRALRETHPDHAVGADAGGRADRGGPALHGGPPGYAAAAWDLVVVDLPAVRDAVRLLALPEQLRRYIGRLLPADRQAARALRPVLAQLAGVPMPAEWAYEAATRADRELAAVQAVIEDAATCVAVVVEPGPAADATLRTARTGIALYGHRLAAVVANRLLPTGSADPFLAGLSGQQQDHLKTLADQCAADGVPLYEAAHTGGPPPAAEEPAAPAIPAAAVEHGSPEAGAAAAETGVGRTRPDPWTVEDRLARDGHLVWSLPLPGATREGLDLVRRGDELVVDAGGFRRIVPLPSALRRCTVQGAALGDGALRVRFTPDPGLWPR